MGLHLTGLILPILVLLPNLLLIFLPPHNMPKKQPSPLVIYTVFERVGQVTCFTLPILFGKKIAEQNVTFPLHLMGLCLIIYYICWIRFFWSGREYSVLFQPLGFIPVPMAIFPIIYFLLLALWLHSFIFAVPAAFFAIGHFSTSWSAYKHIK